MQCVRPPKRTPAVRAIGAAAFGLSAYAWLVRPRYLRWGTTLAERGSRLPGDGTVPHPRQVSNRAVTIEAPAAEVWPWLAQIGQGRGGFYSYDRLENLVGADIHSADWILPEFQEISPGDRVYIGRNGPFYTVADVRPEQYLLLRADAPEGEEPPIEETWLFYLAPKSASRTRLIARNRRAYAPTLPNFLMWKVLVEPLHHIMERKMLLGIKARAEASHG